MLENQTLVIVGGSSGIGYALAGQALSLGAQVVIAGRSAEKLNRAAAGLGGGVRTEQVDATDEQSVVDFFARLGCFDHLVVTIKPQLPAGRFADNDLEAVRDAFDAKFWGQYRLVKHARDTIRADGSIVLTSGIASRRSFTGYSAVSVMNAATEALVQSLAGELAPLRINAVCPGFVDTSPPSAARAEYVKGLAPAMPLQRLGVASEIAQAYVFLLTNAYATGSVLVVDGGATT